MNPRVEQARRDLLAGASRDAWRSWEAGWRVDIRSGERTVCVVPLYVRTKNLERYHYSELSGPSKNVALLLL